MRHTLLLIEDDEVIRENTAEILELANYEVVTADNGKTGVARALEVKPDLVLCDIMMPELDGYGVLYLLSKNPETSGIPFIFLTAKAEQSDIRKGMALGADDYLTKPFEEMDLLNAIEGRLKRSAVFRKDFSSDLEGVSEFLDSARGLAELQELSQDRKVRRYSKKDVIYFEGDRPNVLYFLNSGKVKLYKLNNDGKEYITGLVGAGEFFGYMPILQDTPSSEFAAALEDCEVVRIPRDDFMALVQRNRDVAARFIKMISNNLLEREEQLLSLAYDSVRKRVANALLNLRQRYGKEAGDTFRIDISRYDLAGMAGTASESVIRTLSDFKEDGLISSQGKTISVLDAEGLKQVW